MVTGLAGEDIWKEVLGWGSLDEEDVNETICFIEAKEMARDAMTQPAISFLEAIGEYNISINDLYLFKSHSITFWMFEGMQANGNLFLNVNTPLYVLRIYKIMFHYLW